MDLGCWGIWFLPPGYPSRSDSLPAGITVEGATPPRGVFIVRHCVRR